jgi:hypothetical protein
MDDSTMLCLLHVYSLRRVVLLPPRFIVLRVAASPVEIRFFRAGGSIVMARVDLWRATPSGWEAVAVYDMRDTLSQVEVVQQVLPAGSYTCVFQCFVEESLNGKYEFRLDVAGEPTFADAGDVNTTAASNDSKVYKDQFVLEVPAGLV